MPLDLCRTFHAVGHGAFYTETFQDRFGDFVAVYDCGSKNSPVTIKDAINAEFKAGTTIDVVFISQITSTGWNIYSGTAKSKKSYYQP